jgi:hypothetical protein
VLLPLQVLHRILLRLLCRGKHAVGSLKQLAAFTDLPAEAGGLGLDFGRSTDGELCFPCVLYGMRALPILLARGAPSPPNSN